MGKTLSVSSDFLRSNVRVHSFSDLHAMHFNINDWGAQQHLVSYHLSDGDIFINNGDLIDFESAFTRLSFMGLDNFPAYFKDVYPHIGGENRYEFYKRNIDVQMAKIDQGKQDDWLLGNHDLGFTLAVGHDICGINIKDRELYDFGDGGKALVTHGHRFDPGFLRKYKGLYGVGSRILDVGIAADQQIAEIFPSTAQQYLISNAMKKIGKSYIKKFRKTAVAEAHKVGADAVLTGHIHEADNRMVKVKLPDGSKPRDENGRRIEKRYLNSGDGLTHGTSIILTRDFEWVCIDSKGVSQQDFAYVLQRDNPFGEYRFLTERFLQKSYELHLEYQRSENWLDIPRRKSSVLEPVAA